jgi:DNA-binding transcriptional MerR regulator
MAESAQRPRRAAPGPGSAHPDDGFRGPQVCSIVGISYRQLDYWARTDLLRPSISDAKGSGSQRRYSYQDLVELKVIKRLLDAGLSLQSARRALLCLRDGMGEDVASANLVLGEGSSVLVRTGEEIIDLLKGGQGVLNVLALEGVVQELQSAITSLSSSDAKPVPAAVAAKTETLQSRTGS